MVDFVVPVLADNPLAYCLGLILLYPVQSRIESPGTLIVTVCLFVCLFVGIKPGKLYSTSCVAREVNPLGAVTDGQGHKSRAYLRQRHIPRTCQSMVCNLQVDGLARITDLCQHPNPTHPLSLK